MPPRTKLFRMLPWVGGIDTSTDESMIAPGKLTQGDNITVGVNRSKKSRPGINHNFDSLANGSAVVIAQADYWFGTSSSKTQRRMRVMSDGKVYSETGGTCTEVTAGGKAWTGTLDSASMQVFNNKLIIAVSGSGNLVKYWDGSSALKDLQTKLNHTVVTRSSAGTTRTLVLAQSFLGVNGDYVVIESAGNSAYNGTFQVTGVTTSSLTNDTITYEGTTSLTEGATADATATVNGISPQASVVGEHLGRLLLNDKTDADQLHWSTTYKHEEWLGFGDSGAENIGVGDGDPRGIVGFKSFKGDLFVGKSNRLYRIQGYAPENYSITKISDNLGFVSPDAVTVVDQDACIFVSEKGIHDLATTNSYGDYDSNYLSYDIQPTFNEELSRSRLKYAKVAYLPTLNSVVFAFTEETDTGRQNTNTTSNNALYFYNIPFKEWYRWPDVACESILVANDTDEKRLYLGTHYGRVSKTATGNKYDVSKTGTNVQVRYTLKTGIIYPSSDPYQRVAFKRFGLYYKPSGTHNIAVNVKIDNNALNAENSLSFNEATGATPLGTGFILGSTPLGGSKPLAPYVRQIDGVGRGCRIEISQTATSGEAEIHGFFVEFEDVGAVAEIY